MYENNGSFMMIQLASILVAAVVGYFVYKDANARGMNGVLWGILSFLFCPIAPIIYLVIRKPKTGGGTGF